VQDTDRYGRTVGRVFAGSQDVNAEMVRRGAAWVNRRYSDDPTLLSPEQVARTERRGLWSLPEAEWAPLGTGVRPSASTASVKPNQGWVRDHSGSVGSSATRE
jgi:endonuclease YncB( thermonuclease family)